jgi:Membrane-bound metallopeptidase
MNTPAVDPRFAMDAAAQQELVHRKQSMDSLRQRLGEGKTEEQRLRESCEGFEAIFLQKMWEQMRKNVKKEGYLHSKDEEAYQSMFDVELSKKMAQAGGIGLADMLYEQLSQKLSNSGRTSSPGTFRPPVVQQSATEAEQDKKMRALAELGPKPSVKNTADLSAEALYTEIPATEDAPDPLTLALEELRQEMGEAGAGGFQAGQTLADATRAADAASAQMQQVAERPGAVQAVEQEQNITGASWQANSNVSVKPRPINRFKNKMKQTQPENPPAENSATFSLMPETLPTNPVWPAEGAVSSRFGWHKAGNDREWNAGITIEASAGSPVKACMPGTVVFSGAAGGFESFVVIEHGDGYKSYYGNIEAEGLQVGAAVNAGTEFAYVRKTASGAENAATSSPLYFALKKGEIALNPEVAIRRITTASR